MSIRMALVLLVATLGCGSDSAYRADAAPDGDTADAADPCAIVNARAEDIALCGAVPALADCCGLPWCGPSDTWCSLPFPRGCCGCDPNAPGGPRWMPLAIDCFAR
jgi:hypothetical protein